MTQFYITHTDKYGSKHQLTGAWEASSEEEALAKMFSESGAEDDGRWNVFVVTSTAADII
jgi:hypothetical protein